MVQQAAIKGLSPRASPGVPHAQASKKLKSLEMQTTSCLIIHTHIFS